MRIVCECFDHANQRKEIIHLHAAVERVMKERDEANRQFLKAVDDCLKCSKERDKIAAKVKTLEEENVKLQGEIFKWKP